MSADGRVGAQLATDRHLADLRVEAEHARQRLQLYRARAYGQRPTSPVRMREFERACERAETRLQAAQAQARTEPAG